MPAAYNESVFINCPFDAEYEPMFHALVFAVHDCGYVARCAFELQNAAPSRIARIVAIIRGCKFGIHDISRTELDPASSLPRFNMPLELGIFLGAREFGTGRQSDKVCLVLDRERYRFQRFCSDIAGQDPSAHEGSPEVAIRVVRDWLRTHSASTLPSGQRMAERYAMFRAALPALCEQAELEADRLPFVDYAALVVEWLRATEDRPVSIASNRRVRRRRRAAA